MSPTNNFFPAFRTNVAPNHPIPPLSAKSAKRKRHADHEQGGGHRQLKGEAVTRHESHFQVYDGVAGQWGWSGSMRAKMMVDGPETICGTTTGLLPYCSRTPQTIQNTEVAREMAGLQPPLIDSLPSILEGRSTCSSHEKGTRQQHLDALVAVMHRSTLDGDFHRAGRAWGMLLRAEVNNRSWDVRIGGRWGMGAEILLQQYYQQFATYLDLYNGFTHIRDAGCVRRISSSPELYTKAVDYYERLILQYPYRKALPHSVGPVDFYLALFGLWIRSIVDEQWLSRCDMLAQSPSCARTNKDATAEGEMLESETSSRVVGGRQLDEEGIREDTLRNVNRLADRLDGLLSSPPYCDAPSFWNLKGMSALWLADLSLGNQRSPFDEVIQKDYHQLTPNDYDRLAEIVASSHGQNIGSHDTVKRAKALLKAQDAFGRAASCGNAFEGAWVG
ncbi:MAG: hypothetical protein Q9163_005839 [Psora crenata]